MQDKPDNVNQHDQLHLSSTPVTQIKIKNGLDGSNVVEHNLQQQQHLDLQLEPIPQDRLESFQVPSIDALALNDDTKDEDLSVTTFNNRGAVTPATTTSLAYAYPPPPTYPPLTPTLHKSPISILSTPFKGRGVYATEDILPGTLIEISPVLLLSNDEYYGGGKAGDGKGVEGSVLRGYVFTWKGKEGGMALALGLGSLFNHANTPNVSFELNPTNYTIHYKAFKHIPAGDELCIFYGHNAHFEGDEVRAEQSDEDELWGGLGDVGFVSDVKQRKVKKKWDEEIVPFDQLDWCKVTSLVNPEDQPLTTFKCWATNLPARYSQTAFAFIRKHCARIDELQHLKRIRHIDRSGSPRDSSGGDALLTALLFPVSTAPSNLEELLAQDSTLAHLNLVTFQLDVPATIARTDEQAEEWGKLWPVQKVHIREGPRATPKALGWERAKKAWIRREGERVWKAAKEAGERGEHPIACHVTDTFQPLVHSPASLPKTLVRAFDTRLSTHNCLSHAASNAIDAVAILDRQNLRAPALLPEDPPPYLLSGLTVFISHEPCLLCCMSLLHSRISHLFYIKRTPGSGGLGSVYSVHEDGGLNHRFEVWEWRGGEEKGVGVGLDVKMDT